MTRRQVSYQWRLREIMASRGLFTTTHLAPLLAERGIALSASQIHRLITGTPERPLAARPRRALRPARGHTRRPHRHPR